MKLSKTAIDGWIIWLLSVQEHIESVELKEKDGKSQAVFTLKKPKYFLDKIHNED